MYSTFFLKKEILSSREFNSALTNKTESTRYTHVVQQWKDMTEKIQHLLLYRGQSTVSFSSTASYLAKISFSATFIQFIKCLQPLLSLTLLTLQFSAEGAIQPSLPYYLNSQVGIKTGSLPAQHCSFSLDQCPCLKLKSLLFWDSVTGLQGIIPSCTSVLYTPHILGSWLNTPLFILCYKSTLQFIHFFRLGIFSSTLLQVLTHTSSLST